MDLNYFKDILFDLINESRDLDAADIVSQDAAGIFIITTGDGSRFELRCRRLPEEK